MKIHLIKLGLVLGMFLSACMILVLLLTIFMFIPFDEIGENVRKTGEKLIVAALIVPFAWLEVFFVRTLIRLKKPAD